MRTLVPSGLPSTRHSIPTTCRLRFRQQAAGKKFRNLRFASTCQRTTLELVAKTHQDPPEAYLRCERPLVRRKSRPPDDCGTEDQRRRRWAQVNRRLIGHGGSSD
jgi:hypothetical protein